VIACNKIDLSARRQVTKEQGQEFAKSVSASYFETSAKTKEGVEEMFNDIAHRLFQAGEADSASKNNVNLTEASSKGSGKCC
jgi:GTPase SAR1 family protein